MENRPILLKKWLHVITTIAVLASLVAIGGCQAKTTQYYSAEEVAPKEKQGVMTFYVSVDVPESSDELRVWLPYVTSNEYQSVEDVKVEGNFNYSGIYREAEHGNISLYARWDDPGQNANLTYSFKITRKEIIMKAFPSEKAPVPTDILGKYLLPTSLVSTPEGITEFTANLTRGENTILGKAIAIYDYIVEKGERNPDIIGCGIGDVEALLKDLRGKCVDISSVFVAMARSVGIPAREVFGIRIAKDGEITGAYHCRAEFYLPEHGWVPVDPSDVLKFRLNKGYLIDDPEAIEIRQYYFGAQDETYIDFYTGRDVTLSPMQGGEKLIYFMYPYAEIDGKPLDFTVPRHPVNQEGLEYKVYFEGSG